MIIKTIQVINGKEVWGYYGNVKGFTVNKPLDENRKRWEWKLRFRYNDGELFDSPIMNFEQIYLLNDEGKTIETIRNVSFDRDRILKKALADEAVRQINSAPDDMQISSVTKKATKPNNGTKTEYSSSK